MMILDKKIEHVQLLPGALTTMERGMGSEHSGAATCAPFNAAAAAPGARAGRAPALSKA
jgi:hypothetical protein